ncbi:MAG: hypothetical protein ACR2JC_21035 [Chloroflexota bacterium]
MPVDEILWRRLGPRDVVPEGDSFRISSGAFRTDHSDGLSVHRRKLTDEGTIVGLHPGIGRAEISVAQIQEVEGLRVVAAPILGDPEQPDDPSHALIKPLPKSSKPQKLAVRARIIRLPGAFWE